MESFKLILSCQLCNQFLKGTPINLSCCDATICSEHVQYRTVKVNESKSIQVFECELCQCSHNMRNKRFPVNKSVEKILQLKFEQIYLSEAYENAKKEILNLESSLKKISDMVQDPKNFIFEQVSELRRQVDIGRENFLTLKLEAPKSSFGTATLKPNKAFSTHPIVPINSPF
jgi:hypothetical protein